VRTITTAIAAHNTCKNRFSRKGMEQTVEAVVTGSLDALKRDEWLLGKCLLKYPSTPQGN
jgi:hypothetical protein